MEEDDKVHHLNVFLIKSGFKNPDQVLNLDACEVGVDVPIAGHGVGKLYVKRNPPGPIHRT